MKTEIRHTFIHVLGGILFLLIPFIIGPEGVHYLTDIFHYPDLLREFIVFILALAFFYLNYFVLMPKFYFAKKYILYFSLVVGVFFLTFLLLQLITPFINGAFDNLPRFTDTRPPPPFDTKGPPLQLSHDLFVFFAVTFFSSGLKIINRLQLTEKEKLSSELLYLRSQINPHFLFNTLNSIYSLAIEKSDYTPTAVVKLSGMMRYVISETDQNFVSLEKEIEYIGDYVELQKIRLDDSTVVLYEVKGEILGEKIAPLILIPFIENAFKFGVNPEEDNIISIQVEIIENELNLKVKNSKVNRLTSQTIKSGFGIENAKTRLQLLYPASHSLTFRENEKEFYVSLILNLK